MCWIISYSQPKKFPIESWYLSKQRPFVVGRNMHYIWDKSGWKENTRPKYLTLSEEQWRAEIQKKAAEMQAKKIIVCKADFFIITKMF